MRKLIGCCCAGFAAICCAQTPDESSVVMGSPAAVVAAKDGDIRTESAKFEIPILPDEYWWGGEVLEGLKQPFHAKSEKYAVDMRLRHGVAGGNQAAPVLMSSKGRWIWCEQAFKFAVVDGTLVIETEKAAPIATGTAKDGTLRGAFREVSGKYFPPKGHCRLEFFENPIFNTWIALKYNQNEKEILELGQEYIDNGMTPGVYMIDHTWHGDSFGDWNFHQGRFKDPKGMVAKLKKMGYTAVMLWFDPHISTDTALYRMMRKEKMLLMKKDGWTTAESYWWPGKASILDCTNPKTFAWLKDTCNRLMKDFDCDGFFFDAGDAYNYPMEGVPFVKDATPSDQVKAFHMIGMDVPFQQHRASWKMGGLPLMQTLRDKHPTYEAIHQCIADGIVSGLLGDPYVTFDMVGGGTVSNFEGENFKAAQDHFVRSMQVHALSPMVQFSLSPWRVLDARHQEIVRAMLRLRQTFVPYIVACVKETGRTGEPMMRSLEYNFPGHGYETITDQFMMGEKLLVAPQVVKDAVRRKVVIPPGTWTADDGQVYVGPKTVEIATPLARLPHFVRGEEGAADAPAPNYWCTWATQGSTLGHNAKAGKVAFAGDQGVPRQRDNLNEEVLFGADG